MRESAPESAVRPGSVLSIISAEDFDEKLRQKLLADLDGLVEQLREAATKTKKVSIQEPCPHKGCTCKHVRYVEVPDFALKLKIFEALAERGYGRPGQQESGEDKEKIVFQRLVVMPEETPEDV